jgi:hypothetical protein
VLAEVAGVEDGQQVVAGRRLIVKLPDLGELSQGAADLEGVGLRVGDVSERLGLRSWRARARLSRLRREEGSPLLM